MHSDNETTKCGPCGSEFYSQEMTFNVCCQSYTCPFCAGERRAVGSEAFNPNAQYPCLCPSTVAEVTRQLIESAAR